MTIYDHETPFYDAIIEEPESDEARLIFADWLEEQGDSARAEFIRVQCSLEHVPFWDDQWTELKGREKVLWQANQQEWTAGIVLKPIQYRFRRGFLDRVILSRGMEIETVKSMVELFPTIQSLKLKTAVDLNRFGKLPWFGRLRQLNLAGTWIPGQSNSNERALNEIAGAKNLQQLTAINLYGTLLGDSSAALLMQPERLPNLKKLSISAGGLESKAVAKRVFDSPKFRQLKWLDISSNWTLDTAGGINSVFANQPSSSLEFLEIGWGTTASGTLRKFIRSKAFQTVKHLNINMPLIDRDVVEMCNQSSKIETLSLTDASIAQVQTFAQDAPIWNSLKVLDLPCRSRELPKLFCSPQFGQLKCLNSHSLTDPNAIKMIKQELGIKVNDPNFSKRPNPF